MTAAFPAFMLDLNQAKEDAKRAAEENGDNAEALAKTLREERERAIKELEEKLDEAGRTRKLR